MTSANTTRSRLLSQKLQLPLICAGFAFILAGWGGVLLWHKVRFTTKFQFHHIKVLMQSQHVYPINIARDVQKNLHGNFFLLNTDELRTALLANPWIEKVSFRRLWPDTLEVSAQERVPVARWGSAALISSTDTIFTPSLSTIPLGLVKFIGADATMIPLMRKQYQHICHALSVLHAKITSLSVDARYEWSFKLNDQLSVHLGEALFDERLKKFVALYQNIIKNNKQKALVVDLRYPDGAAIAWESPSKISPSHET